MKNIILTLCMFACCIDTIHAQVINKKRLITGTVIEQPQAPSSSTTKSPYKVLGHYWHNVRKDNLTISAENGKSLARRENYKFVRYDGFILETAANNEGQAVPLYLYYHRGRKDYFTTASSAGIEAAEASGYKKVATEGYVLKTVSAKFSALYKPLWLFYSDARQDNFVTANDQGIRDANAGGYREVRIEGYVRKTDKPNRLISIISASDSMKVAPPPPSHPKPKALCLEEKMREIRAVATDTTTVKIDCSCTLSPNDTITKQLIFEESNVVCDCNGATLGIANSNHVNYNIDMIQVRSVESDGIWTRPQYVTIKNCKINGAIRILGMGGNGEAAAVKESSRQDATNPQHVQRVRNNAPKNIVFDNITITGIARNPFYIAPGVTYTTLINSEIKGKADYVAIYLDAESAYNTIKNNYIHVKTREDLRGKVPNLDSRGWPQIAIDGSSHNKIIGNRFAGLNNGGIYLYRNCGEGGTIRHTPPEHNDIINNYFYYKEYRGWKPAIYLGSRDYGKAERHGPCGQIWGKDINLGQCHCDDGWPYGSSASDKDYARYNVIMQNQLQNRAIYKVSQSALAHATVSDMIVTKNRSLNSPNYITENEIVSAKIDRKSGCYVENGYKDFLLHGESIDVFNINGKLTCADTKATCNDGKLIYTSTNCEIVEVPFECFIESNNNGCSKTVSAPAGTKIVGVKVACNLEFGSVSDSQLAAVTINQIKVIRASDDREDGSCFIGEISIRKGAKTLYDIQDQLEALIGCKEHDQNGGDCHIKGILYCR